MGIPTTLVVSIAERLLENIWKDKTVVQAARELTKIGRICTCLERIEAMLAVNSVAKSKTTCEDIAAMLKQCSRTQKLKCGKSARQIIKVSAFSVGGPLHFCCAAEQKTGSGCHVVCWNIHGQFASRFSTTNKIDKRWDCGFGKELAGFFIAAADAKGNIVGFSPITRL